MWGELQVLSAKESEHAMLVHGDLQMEVRTT
jgi:hypothetical protein